jgi:hypothetical protein
MTENKKIVSFDVGIKNMAYCVFELSYQLEILEWGVLNLITEQTNRPSQQLCNCVLESSLKKKGAQPKICNKKAKYSKGDEYFCEKHASCSRYIILNKECSQPFIKKQTNASLITLCKNRMIYNDAAGIRVEFLQKKDLIDLLNTFYEKNGLTPIKVLKNKSAGEVDLITIGRNLKQQLDNMQVLRGVTHVIIENQISPIATRMKTIQGMLCQYFIMCSQSSIVIEFISSCNKLKGFVENKNTCANNSTVVNSIDNSREEVEEGEEVGGGDEEVGGYDDGDNDSVVLEPQSHSVYSMDKTKYAQNKKNSIDICSRFLENNSSLEKWRTSMTTRKKDDLADCFLQGIWYMKNKKWITHNNDLNIR